MLARTGCVLSLVLGLAACGGTTTTTTTNAAGQTVVTCHESFAKTKLLLHLGLAFTTFDRYIYKPYKAGAFKSGASGRVKALLKAGASALVVYHELKLADQDARCGGPTLSKLAAPVSSAASGFATLKGALSGGNLGAIASSSSLLGTLTTAAKSNGVSVG